MTETSSQRRIKMSLKQSPTGQFNPFGGNHPNDYFVMAFLFQSPLYVNENLEIGVRLAESYQMAEDALSLRLDLRPNITWHDGTPLTNEDLIFTIERCLHPNFPGRKRYSFLQVKGAQEYADGHADSISGLERIGEHGIIFHLKHPDPNFNANLLMLVAPKHIFEAIPPEETFSCEAGRQPVGCGSFQFESFDAESGTTCLIRNENYFLGRPPLAGIEIQVNESQTMIEKFNSNQVDYGYPEIDDLLQIASEQHLTYSFPSLDSVNLAIRGFSKEQRQWLSHTIDRDQVTGQLLNGHAASCQSFYTPLHWCQEQLQVNSEADGVSLQALPFQEPVTLAYVESDQVQAKLAKQFQKIWSEAGLEVRLNPVAKSEFQKKILISDESALWIWRFPHGIEPEAHRYFGPQGIYKQFLKWQNDLADEIIKKLQDLDSHEERVPLYQELSDLFQDELPLIPIATVNELQLLTKDIGGTRPDPRGAIWNIHEVFFK